MESLPEMTRLAETRQAEPEAVFFFSGHGKMLRAAPLPGPWDI